MFRHKIDPDERSKVLELLGRWHHAITRIDGATNAMKLTIAEQPLGIQSEEFEKARLAALVVAERVRTDTIDPQFWPILQDNTGAKIMFELHIKLEESYTHQLNILNLLGVAADAFRSGRDSDAPTAKEMMSVNQAFARVLDEMGAIAGKLAKHYHISVQEYQHELQG